MTGALFTGPLAPIGLARFAPWLTLCVALGLREGLRERRELTSRSLALTSLGLLGLILPATPAMILALALHGLFDPSWGDDLRAPEDLAAGDSDAPGPPGPAPALSIVIPAWNEAERLPATLDALDEALAPETALARDLELFSPGPTGSHGVEIVVADDGSTDATARRCGERPGLTLVQLEHHRGKGAALRAGVARSRGERVLTFDADGATAIEELRRLWPERAGSNTGVKAEGKSGSEIRSRIIIGSRYAPDARIDRRQSPLRVLLGRLGNLLIRAILLRRPPRDTQCGFKLFEGPLARQIFRRCRTDGWAIDMEVLAIAELHGLEVVERGVRWRDVGASRLRVLRDAPTTLAALLSLRLALDSGRLSRSA